MALASLNVPQKVDTPLRLSLSVSLAGAARPGASRLFLLCVGIAMSSSALVCASPPSSGSGASKSVAPWPGRRTLSLSLSLSFIAAALHALGSIEECGEELGADGSRARVGESGSATSMGWGWGSSDAELDSWRAVMSCHVMSN